MFSAVVRSNYDLPKPNGPSFVYCRVCAFSAGFCPHYVASPAISDSAAILGDATTWVLRPPNGKLEDCVFDAWRFCSADQFMFGFDGIRRPVDLDGKETILMGEL